jgi:hypothetical protein
LRAIVRPLSEPEDEQAGEFKADPEALLRNVDRVGELDEEEDDLEKSFRRTLEFKDEPDEDSRTELVDDELDETSRTGLADELDEDWRIGLAEDEL